MLQSVLQRSFEAAARSYHDAAVLARETGARMDERLSLTKIQPRRIVDLGCATGDGIRALQRRYPSAQAIAIDYAIPMLQSVRSRSGSFARLTRRGPQLLCADAHALPLAEQSTGLVWSNLMLQWFDDPSLAFREMHRVLEVGGLLMFTALGPDTLKELRNAAGRAACGRDNLDGTTGGMTGSSRTTASGIRNFVDMHDLGDMLLAAGFADPVMDMEMVTMTYSRHSKFLADQRHLGVRNALLGSRSWQDWRKVFNAWSRDSAHRLPMTFEIIYGHAWRPATRPPTGETSVIHFHRREATRA